MIDYRRNENGVLEISVSGKITKEQIDSVWAKMKADMPPSGKVRVLEVIRDFEGMDLGALWEDLRVGLPIADRVSHAAIVTDQRWIAALTRLASTFMSAETRTFTVDQLAEARAWIDAA